MAPLSLTGEWSFSMEEAHFSPLMMQIQHMWRGDGRRGHPLGQPEQQINTSLAINRVIDVTAILLSPLKTWS